MLSDHLPVQLGLKVIDTAQKETDLLVGTWNIEGDDLAKKVSDPETSRLLEAAVKKFDILVFQELFDASSTPYIMQVDTTVPLGKPEHGYFLQDTGNVKLAVDTTKIKHFQVGNNGKSVSRIPVSTEVNSNEKYKVCFYSIHFQQGIRNKGTLSRNSRDYRQMRKQIQIVSLVLHWVILIVTYPSGPRIP